MIQAVQEDRLSIPGHDIIRDGTCAYTSGWIGLHALEVPHQPSPRCRRHLGCLPLLSVPISGVLLPDYVRKRSRIEDVVVWRDYKCGLHSIARCECFVVEWFYRRCSEVSCVIGRLLALSRSLQNQQDLQRGRCGKLDFRFKPNWHVMICQLRQHFGDL